MEMKLIVILGLISLALSYALARLIIHKKKRSGSYSESVEVRFRHYVYLAVASASLLTASGFVGWLAAENTERNFAGYSLAVALGALGFSCGAFAYRAFRSRVLDTESPVAQAIVQMGREKGFRVRQVVVVESSSFFARGTLGATVEVSSRVMQTLRADEAAAFAVYCLGIRDNTVLYTFLLVMTVVGGQTLARRFEGSAVPAAIGILAAIFLIWRQLVWPRLLPVWKQKEADAISYAVSLTRNPNAVLVAVQTPDARASVLSYHERTALVAEASAKVI